VVVEATWYKRHFTEGYIIESAGVEMCAKGEFVFSKWFKKLCWGKRSEVSPL
jgi:hypothetical protein